MANRDLLKEAIADAKAVKETAIANAKAALEEAFTPLMQEKFAKKIAQLDEEDELEEAYEMEEGKKEAEKMEEEVEESYGMDEANDKEGYEGQMGMKKLGTKKMEEAEEMDEEMDLDELLRELDEMDENINLTNFPDEEGEHGNVAGKNVNEDARTDAEEEGYLDGMKDEKEDKDDEEIDLENMDEGDLKKFIEDVIADMVASGELEGDMGGEEEVEGEEEMDMDMDMEMDEEMEITERKKYGGNKGDVPAAKRGDKKDTAEEEGVEDYKKKVKEMEEKLEEAYTVLETIKSELNEVNLLNAKLLYTNKIFKAKNLTEVQKVKVLEAFDKAASVKEAKLVFETLSSGVASTVKKPVNESLLRGSASKALGIIERKPIMEADAQVLRMQKLAGIIK